jgi:hypothetical protein
MYRGDHNLGQAVMAGNEDESDTETLAEALGDGTPPGEALGDRTPPGAALGEGAPQGEAHHEGGAPGEDHAPGSGSTMMMPTEKAKPVEKKRRTD